MLLRVGPAVIAAILTLNVKTQPSATDVIVFFASVSIRKTCLLSLLRCGQRLFEMVKEFVQLEANFFAPHHELRFVIGALRRRHRVAAPLQRLYECIHYSQCAINVDWRN